MMCESSKTSFMCCSVCCSVCCRELTFENVYQGSKYDARVLEDLFRDQYGNGQLLDSAERPYCFMVSTLASVVPAQPFLWLVHCIIGVVCAFC